MSQFPSPESDLIRPEVLEHRADRLYGEVVLTQPLSTHMMVFLIVLISAGAMTWLVLGHYARIETAPGILVADKQSIKVMVPVPGLVTMLDVQEGSLVKRGDRLAVVTLDFEGESKSGVASRHVASVNPRAGSSVKSTGYLRAKQANEEAWLASNIQSTDAQIAGFQPRVAIHRQIIASNEDSFNHVTPRAAGGFPTRTECKDRHGVCLCSEEALSVLKQNYSSTYEQSAQACARLASGNVTLSCTVNSIQTPTQTLTQQSARRSVGELYVVKAPIDGRVSALQVGIGSAASPNISLMTILPVDATVHAEVYATSRAIGFLHTGQETRLLYEAFPYQRFGSFRGVVTSVSRSIINPRESVIPIQLDESVYKIAVRPDDQSVVAFDKTLPLQPGMALKANIVLERQSFLDWLLAPIRAVTNRS